MFIPIYNSYYLTTAHNYISTQLSTNNISYYSSRSLILYKAQVNIIIKRLNTVIYVFDNR